MLTIAVQGLNMSWISLIYICKCKTTFSRSLRCVSHGYTCTSSFRAKWPWPYASCFGLTARLPQIIQRTWNQLRKHTFRGFPILSYESWWSEEKKKIFSEYPVGIWVIKGSPHPLVCRKSWTKWRLHLVETTNTKPPDPWRSMCGAFKRPLLAQKPQAPRSVNAYILQHSTGNGGVSHMNDISSSRRL